MTCVVQDTDEGFQNSPQNASCCQLLVLQKLLPVLGRKKSGLNPCTGTSLPMEEAGEGI